ncbi:hypothetical protein VT85_04295 [Planctomyces sp. SH-PL62]|nr:hypothetical protein VT85_04295 [Planctomyces sp. SH-PL62]
MRTRRAFRPHLESMPTRDLPSSTIVSNPLAPIMVPTQPTQNYLDPSQPYHITTPGPYDEPYAGPNPTSPLDPNPDEVVC